MLTTQEFRDRIKKKDIHHTYLLAVKEEYDFKLIYQDIKKYIFNDEINEFSLEKIDGESSDLTEIMNEAGMTSFAADKKLILVRNSGALKDYALERFEDFLTRDDFSNILLLLADGDPPKKKWIDLIKKKNLYVNIEGKSEKDVIGWIINYARKLGYQLERDAAILIVDSIGNNINELTNQLTKIQNSLQQGEPIDSEIVKNLILRSRSHNYWELSDSLGNKNLAESLKILNEMIDDGEAEPLIIGIISNFFRKIGLARELYDKGADINMICDAVGQKWYKEKFLSQVKNYKLNELNKITTFLRQTDENIKSGFLTPRQNLERLVIGICSNSLSFPSPVNTLGS
ncbi:MAG: DNA polymerase III subunit delta [Acidobacteria bacterium]|nr:DNA polymerase III subunit delta [Acidobacteriota bacterium]